MSQIQVGELVEKNVPTNNESRSKYTSKWDYTLDVSRWHFDKWKVESDPYKVFMRVEGDWVNDLKDLNFEIDVSTLNYGYKGTDHDPIIENDYLAWGYKNDMVQYGRTYKLPDSLIRLGESLKLKHPDIRVHQQMPGQVAPIHVDTFCSHPAMDQDPTLDVSELRRFVIQLTDWDWGHFWAFGNNTWSQWKAGDVVYFESRDVIHCTANAGKEPRLTMTVTGWMTDETKNLIESDFNIIKI